MKPPRLVIFMLVGPENPRRCVTPFLVAMAALASEWDVSIYFASDGVLLLKRGAADDIVAMEGGRPLPGFMQDTIDPGARLHTCTPAVQLHHLTTADLIENVEAACATSLLEETRHVDTVLTI